MENETIRNDYSSNTNPKWNYSKTWSIKEIPEIIKESGNICNVKKLSDYESTSLLKRV
jgi:predicted house-cleaning noncanonical NTP pyrophosphatase (MazG superfamily)